MSFTTHKSISDDDGNDDDEGPAAIISNRDVHLFATLKVKIDGGMSISPSNSQPLTRLASQRGSDG